MTIRRIRAQWNSGVLKAVGLRRVRMLAIPPRIERLVVDANVGVWKETGKTILNAEFDRGGAAVFRTQRCSIDTACHHRLSVCGHVR